MKKHILLLFFAAFYLSLFGCLPVDKKVVVPEYDKAGTYKSSGSGEDVPLEKPPQILLESTGLKQEKEYQKHDEPELGKTPVLEEDIAASGSTEIQRQVLGKSHVSLKLPDEEYVSSRLMEYTKALKEWNSLAEKMVAFDAGAEWPEKWHECVQGLEYMVFGYKRVLSLLQGGTGTFVVPQGENPWGIVQKDVHYLESDCRAVFRKGSALLDDVLFSYGNQEILSLKTLLRQLMETGDYQGVISAYENSTDVRLGEDVEFVAHFMYAQALLHENRFEESVRLMGEVLRQEGMLDAAFIKDSSEVWQAVMRYAELLVVMGQERNAKSVYLQLDDLFAVMRKDSEWVTAQLHFLNDYKKSSDKYAAFVLLLKEYTKYDGRGIPKALVSQYERIIADFNDMGLQSIARQVMRQTEEGARQWAKIKLQEVDYLIQEKDFQSARNILETLVNLPQDMAEEVQHMLKSLPLLESEAAEMRGVLEKEELLERWENAVALFDAGKYEQAIDAFSFLSRSEYHQKAEKKVKEAVDRLAVRLRKEAANLFAAGRQTNDPYEKSNMMMQSRDILLYILKRYPEAKNVGKVEENLRVLEGQIRTLNSSLLAQ